MFNPSPAAHTPTESPRLGFHLRTTPLTRGSGYHPRVPPRIGNTRGNCAAGLGGFSDWASHEEWGSNRNGDLARESWRYVAVCQNLVPLVNIKIAGKWMFIPLKMVLIGIDPYPCVFDEHHVFQLHLSEWLKTGSQTISASVLKALALDLGKSGGNGTSVVEFSS